MLSLDVIVVGGGIAGLACAFALSKAKHRVRVLEKFPQHGRLSSGVRVPPNLTKILLEWGLQDELTQVAQRCRSTPFSSLETGEPVGRHEWRDDLIQETGADFLLMHHEDLLRMLTALAISAGVVISYSCPVTDININSNQSQQKVSVNTLAHVELHADVVIGADGPGSVVRKVVFAKEGAEAEQVDTGMSAFTATIPGVVIREGDDPSLASLLDQPEWQIWMGSSRSVLGYPIRNGKEFVMHFFWPDRDTVDERLEGTNDDWVVKYSNSAIKLDACEPRIQRLLSMAPYLLRTRYMKRTHAADWVDASARVVLIGEAAHPSMPCGMHSCSMAVEDGAVLGALFSHLRDVDQIRPLMDAFQELRQKRCQALHLSELKNNEVNWLPPSLDRDARDKRLRSMSAPPVLGHQQEEAIGEEGDKASTGWDEGRLREEWERVGGMFGYEAKEAAEDWWVRWGTLRESSKEIRAFDPLDLRVQVQVTRVTKIEDDYTQQF